MSQTTAVEVSPTPIAWVYLVPGGRLPNELNGADPVCSTEQQLVHAEWEAFTICEKEGPSCAREDGIIQGRLDS